jgi:hypothetical protein
MGHLLMGAGAVVILLALWLGVQSLARRQTPGATEDVDVLAC